MRRVPDHIFDQFSELVLRLAENPTGRRPGVDIQRLKSDPNTFRVRLGEYRVLYTVDKVMNLVKITSLTHRRSVYRGYVL